MTTTAAPPDPTEVRELFRAALGHAPAQLADRLAEQWATIAAALVPGAVADTEIGEVTCDPDPRFPDTPFVRRFDETRWRLQDLGAIYLPDPAAGAS